MKPAIDERGGWTSASSAEADSLCPGRHLAQRGLPEETKSADAESGTRIHAWLEGAWAPGNAPKLSADEQETADKCREIELALVSQIFGESTPKSQREYRAWSTFGDYKHSGKADVVYVFADTAAVFDFKTGRNEATESPRNLQLRDLAVLTASCRGVKRVHVAIIQPWATMKPEVCTYEIDDLFNAQCELMARIAASNDPKAPRVPGDRQCQYCRAKATCAEFLKASLPVADFNAALETTKEHVGLAISQIDSTRLGKFLSLVRLAEETATDEVRRRIEAGETVDGWTLKPGRETEKITDAQTVFSRALAAGITQDAFVRDCITVCKTALKAALKTATGAKGKDLDGKLDSLIAGATETKTSSQVLSQNNNDSKLRHADRQ